MDQINNTMVCSTEYLGILTFSFLLLLFIFCCKGNRYLGNLLREFYNSIFYKKQNLLIIFIFFVSLILIIYLNNSVVFLDDKISINIIEITNKNFSELISKQFGIFKNNINYTITSEDTTKIIQELNLQNPDWRNDFIVSKFYVNSPLESNNSLTQFVLEALNNQLVINYVTVYLLLMLLIILICKFILNKDIKFNSLDKYPFGIYINKLLTKYISVWQKIGNFWIFFILISLIFFNFVVTISTNHLILLLNN